MKSVLILAYLARFAASYLLRFLNLRHLKLHGTTVPAGFEGCLDSEALAKSASYTLDQSRVALLHSIYDSAILLAFLFTPLFPLYDAWIGSLTGSFVLSGVLFVLFVSLIEGVLDIPFSLYTTFRLERRYGFNTTTFRLWLSDLLKSTLLSTLLLALLGSIALLIVRHSPALWWLWVWLFFALFSVTMIYLSPYLIEPLFSKFEPLKDAELAEEIRELLKKGGIEVKEVQQMDASRRSLHSNAYFTGIGRVKRIVLYDTLVKQMSRAELLAILAHEGGHWKKGHIWKTLLLTESAALLVIWASYRLIVWGGLPMLFGMPQGSFPAQLVMIGFLASILSFLCTPFFSWLSRRNEWQADGFAAELTGTPEALGQALIKLSRENL
ncbi:M48 family metallopeptidase, partial [Geomonas sp.]|uniref:M48 family metallopeptidase n=1 Tax=Geomonas sp. TaxID=2651584 RepID=UPI002B496D2B